MLLISTMEEVVAKIKEFKTTVLETAFKIKCAFKENNMQCHEFLMFLLKDDNTPVLVKS